MKPSDLDASQHRRLKQLGVVVLAALVASFVGAGVAAGGNGELGYLIAMLGIVAGIAAMLSIAVYLLFASRKPTQANHDV